MRRAYHGSHQLLKVPMIPFGSSSVTRMNNAPSMNSQYGASGPDVTTVLAQLPTTARSAARISVPRPPTATQITASMEFPGANSPGLMMPTCGTYSAPAPPAMQSDSVNANSL